MYETDILTTYFRNDYQLKRQHALWWRWQSVPPLKHEYHRRGLSTKGTKAALYHRLEVSDRKMKEGADGTAADELMLHVFSTLPVEIRLMVWGCTLPGPRAIAVDIDSRTTKLCSPIEFRSLNPVALSVCVESRELTLKTYRPFLSRKDIVYAGFDHGDYLYFGN